MKENEMTEAQLEELISANGGFDGETVDELIGWMEERRFRYSKETLQNYIEKKKLKDIVFYPHGKPIPMEPGPTTTKEPLR